MQDRRTGDFGVAFNVDAPLSSYDLDTRRGLALALEVTLLDWRHKMRVAVSAREKVARVRAETLLAPVPEGTKQTADQRAAAAALATCELVSEAERLEYDAKDARFRVDFIVGLAGGRTVIET